MKKITLIVVAITALGTLRAQAPAPRVIEIAAKRFEFTPNTITLKRGEPVTIKLTASDHAHGLLLKDLHIDLDAIPGQPDQVTITPESAGTFSAICDDYCGSGHGNMKIAVVVEP